MANRIASTVLLALALGFSWVSPASAFTRWASFSWAPATGPVVGYAVYSAKGNTPVELIATVATPSATVPVASSTYLSIRVAAYDSAGGFGPFSDPSYPIRLCPGDFEGDEIIQMRDATRVASCIGQTTAGACGGADLNLDGTIRLADLNAVNSKVGTDACVAVRTPKPCPGDFNGDGSIGIQDSNKASACIDLPAIGFCAAGDFDGNGWVSLFEAQRVSAAIGTNACTH